MLTTLNKLGDKLHLKSTTKSSSKGNAYFNEDEFTINAALNRMGTGLSEDVISNPPIGGLGIHAGPDTAKAPRSRDNRHSALDYQQAKGEFLAHFPEYRQTKVLDSVREKEFARLKQGDGTVYMDYMGGCLYPEMLVKQHLEQLTTQVLGNTHSDSPSSKLSEATMLEARATVLSYFGASPEDYVCIFTPNCTGALKIIGESFPFHAPTQPKHRGQRGSTSCFILGEDSHNSVNGIREFAERAGAEVKYVKAHSKGGFDQVDMMSTLWESPPRAGVESLVAITGQSNISGFRPDLLPILSEAKRLGYSTLVDAAALASTCQIVVSKTASIDATNATVTQPGFGLPTPPASPFAFGRRSLSRPSSSSSASASRPSLHSSSHVNLHSTSHVNLHSTSRVNLHSSSHVNLPLPPTSNHGSRSAPTHGNVVNLEDQADAIAVSFYKMFGYPTGVGALIIKKSLLAKFKKPWFAGGTVEAVGVPRGVTESQVPYERFEEGTINYTSLSAVSNGLQWLSKYTHSSVLSTRLSALHIWLYHSLEQLKHANGMPVVRIYTRDPSESRYSKFVTGSETKSKVGYVISCTFHRADGTQIPISHVSSRAARNTPAISLRTGCVCNPGGGMALLGLRGRFGPKIQRWLYGERASEDVQAGCGQEGRCKPADKEDPVRLHDFYRDVGVELGIVRLSLGIVTNFRDVWEVLKFATTFVESY